MSEESKTIEQSVNDAANSLAESSVTKPGDTSTPPETSTEETRVEVDEETAEAITLLRALKDPQKAHLVIKNLATQAGLLKDGEQLSKGDEKAIARDFKAVAKKHLGNDFSYLAEKLGEIMEEVLSAKDNEFNTRLAEIERRNAEREFTREYNKFFTDNKVTEEEAGTMIKLSEEIAPGPNVPLSTYLNRLLKLTRSEKAGELKNKVAEARRANNQARNAEAKGVEGSQFKVEKPPSKISPKDAVMAAFQGIQFED